MIPDFHKKHDTCEALCRVYFFSAGSAPKPRKIPALLFFVKIRNHKITPPLNPPDPYISPIQPDIPPLHASRPTPPSTCQPFQVSENLLSGIQQPSF